MSLLNLIMIYVTRPVLPSFFRYVCSWLVAFGDLEL